MGLWSVTTLTAPICGPILGGTLCDGFGWPLIFLINVPVAAGAGLLAWRLLVRPRRAPAKLPFDTVGLALLVTWVGLLQVTLDLGKDQDWFASPLIAGMSLTSAIAFIAFLIWELTSEHPIVNLRVFRHLGFTVPLIVLAFGLGGFFATNVLTPLWLQTNMGYTSAQAGMAASATGILAVATGPLVAMMVARVDNRIIAFAGVSWLLVTSLMRGVANTDMTFWQVWTVLLLVGAAMPAFFMPLMTMSLAAVEPEETAGASGLSNFVRTLAGAVATSLLTTAWEDSAASHHAELAGSLNGLGGAMGSLERGGRHPGGDDDQPDGRHPGRAAGHQPDVLGDRGGVRGQPLPDLGDPPAAPARRRGDGPLRGLPLPQAKRSVQGRHKRREIDTT
jgi:DHA2 family multidrug resistance protein